ncbi:hypothetical protein [Blastochloris viridis]|uniref:Uncharacterized protein n=1 Tax=Blastochloris viridis TaxID=1079 RepID=A0A0H5B6Q3_BLAVI|nr:hypothetical protein [Blastochloris viridis]ALK08840.1 hypothetical protein BVIR_1051 [Blastochloris viridis]BAR97860.1 hypothetical protein BV133_267 [Blastochloris viridis]CUU41501.1 hypothetical protein BVIRIDIS_04940 [Blastochloris viridis]
MSDLGLQQQPAPAKPKPRRRGFWAWLGFSIVVTMVTTMSVGLLCYHTGFLRIPFIANTVCGSGLQIGFVLTEYPNPQTGLTLVDKQLGCFDMTGQLVGGASFAMLKLWLIGAVIWSGVLEALLGWRRRWELRRAEQEAKDATANLARH